MSVAWVSLAACLLLAACASPPPAKVNLSGFPPEFQQGYADGCVSVGGRSVRNEVRFKTEYQYASGWRDGNSMCKR